MYFCRLRYWSVSDFPLDLANVSNEDFAEIVEKISQLWNANEPEAQCEVIAVSVWKIDQHPEAIQIGARVRIDGLTKPSLFNGKQCQASVNDPSKILIRNSDGDFVSIVSNPD